MQRGGNKPLGDQFRCNDKELTSVQSVKAHGGSRNIAPFIRSIVTR